ncbi:MAG: methyltransferase [Candidatus Micrarchaeales archaeon]|jgi:HemK-related putative methylase|nr:methyltransferase [Candidatus Micrarchaeales archaeon]
MIYESVKITGCRGVYYPAEDSYMLAKIVERKAFGKVLDLGTGTGIQGIVAAKAGCEVYFSDISENALQCAEKNAELNGVHGRFLRSDLFSKVKGRFNTIIFNPPYLESGKEIRYADLDGGVLGRELIDRFLSGVKEFLLPDNTVLLVENSDNDYMREVRSMRALIEARAHYFFEDIVVLSVTF